MREFAIAATFAAIVGGAMFNAPAYAVDFVFGGHKHCWYAEGWHGAGWYWCGYAHRDGKGWGGPEGWQGWKH